MCKLPDHTDRDPRGSLHTAPSQFHHRKCLFPLLRRNYTGDTTFSSSSVSRDHVPTGSTAEAGKSVTAEHKLQAPPARALFLQGIFPATLCAVAAKVPNSCPSGLLYMAPFPCGLAQALSSQIHPSEQPKLCT